MNYEVGDKFRIEDATPGFVFEILQIHHVGSSGLMNFDFKCIAAPSTFAHTVGISYKDRDYYIDELILLEKKVYKGKPHRLTKIFAGTSK